MVVNKLFTALTVFGVFFVIAILVNPMGTAFADELSEEINPTLNEIADNLADLQGTTYDPKYLGSDV